MKLLISADIHSKKSAVDSLRKKALGEEPDFIIVAGDLSVFEREIDAVLSDIASIGLPTMIIPGNHETPEDLQVLCGNYENIIYLHSATYELDDYLFIGYGNPGFALVEPAFEKFVGKAKKQMKDKKVILITHGPPYGTKLDLLYGDHVGCKSITKFIRENNNILLAISGHIHENFGVKDKIGKTRLINPGPSGEIVDL